eukprot:CAMPEP_0172040358 /NCGR_PEP_ID=MMETSP1041-20130122/24453_1 /TAXON_ID=464988 /ORGANISM="Hemiselmis andersenii, Strain CCMP439" /LENGTH=220 /DNA_ID=CAMNT_0012698245 /DNA_START=71 /DNA_END=730 /DNA_ORIENTATION=-
MPFLLAPHLLTLLSLSLSSSILASTSSLGLVSPISPMPAASDSSMAAISCLSAPKTLFSAASIIAFLTLIGCSAAISAAFSASSPAWIAAARPSTPTALALVAHVLVHPVRVRGWAVEALAIGRLGGGAPTDIVPGANRHTQQHLPDRGLLGEACNCEARARVREVLLENVAVLPVTPQLPLNDWRASVEAGNLPLERDACNCRAHRLQSERWRRHLAQG